MYKLIVFPLFILQLTNVVIRFLLINWDFILKLHCQNTAQPVDIHSETTDQPIAIHFKRTGHSITIYSRNFKENGFVISENFYINNCKFNITLFNALLNPVAHIIISLKN